MTYSKPELVAMDGAVTVIRGVHKQCPINADGGGVYEFTPNAYEADE